MLNRLLASSKGRERTFLLTTLNVNSLIKCLTAATITQRQSLPFLLDTLDRGLIAYVRLTGMTRRGGQQLKPRQEMLLSWSDWDGKRFAGREGEGEGGEEYSRSSSVSSFITVSVSQSLHYSFVLEPPSPPHSPPANAPVLGSVLMSNPTKQSHIIHWKKKKKTSGKHWEGDFYKSGLVERHWMFGGTVNRDTDDWRLTTEAEIRVQFGSLFPRRSSLDKYETEVSSSPWLRDVIICDCSF